MHQRQDIRSHDDRCRVQSDKTLRPLGRFRRIADSLFMEGRALQCRLDHVTAFDFQTLMVQDHRTATPRMVPGKRPSLKSLS